MTQKTVKEKKNLSLLVHSSQSFQTYYSKRELTFGGLQLICKSEALGPGDPMLLCQLPSTKLWLEGLRGSSARGWRGPGAEQSPPNPAPLCSWTHRTRVVPGTAHCHPPARHHGGKPHAGASEMHEAAM